jgi:hypothetical protein
VSVALSADNSNAAPSASATVDQASALLRVTKLTSTSPSNRKTVTVVAAIQNIAVAGSKTATSINLKVTLLRTAHPAATVTPSADWSNNGGSTNVYNFGYSKALAPGASTVSDLNALIDYNGNSGGATFVLTGDVTGANAVAEAQKTNGGQDG